MALSIVATPVVDGLIKKLGSVVWAELGLICGVKNDIRKLQDQLSTISLVLQDAETRAITDAALHKWLKDLKYAAFDADDVLDEFQTEEGMYNGKKEKVCRFFSSRNSVLFRYKMARKIKKIRETFDEIAEAREKFHLKERATSVESDRLERETFSSIDEEEVFGRDDDKENVIKWVIGGDNDRDHVSVLPIVGLGGSGKTTLAKLVYNDEGVKRHFEIRMWVCVGETFDVNAIMKAALECATNSKCGFSRLQDMQQQFQEKLGNKRYLLILDDVWGDNIGSRWETVKALLRNSTYGNKIVATTRSLDVATIMGTVPDPYKLGVLSDDICWELFEKRAFGSGKARKTPNLVRIGKVIVKRCAGLPLAVKSLGSLMSTKQEEQEWLAIKDSKIWSFDREIIPALQLSYNHLPPSLKQCFTYCSVFPKDYEIKKSRLIQLWIAQGFVQSEEDRNIEDIGNDYFNTLLRRSFFQDEERDDFDNILSCKMHDLVHDLACYVAKDESSIVEIDKKKLAPHGCLYSSIVYHDRSSPTSSTIAEVSYETKRLRSFFLFSQSIYEGPVKFEEMDCLKFSKAISNLIRLRALHLHCVSEKSIVSILGRLRHLRFLTLSHLEVEYLPDSITNLRNLQTLNLHECPKLKELPKNIKMMRNIRHLDIRLRFALKRCNRLSGMPRGIGKLTNLQTLSSFHVGEKGNYAGIAELQDLNQIKGYLRVSGLENVKDAKDALEAKLSCKSGLQSLDLIFDIRIVDLIFDINPEEVLENLRPHLNLKELSIKDYKGNKLPNWLTNLLLPNLVRLELSNLPACESLPPLGLLPSLRTLYLYDMDGLKKIGRELYGGESAASAVTTTITFPSLKEMVLKYADNLEEWSVPERDAFPSLESLQIEHCPKLRIQGRLPSSLVKLDISSSHEELLAAGGCLQGLSRLRDLKIRDMKASTSGWEGVQHLTGLEELRIRCCSELIRLPEGLIQHHFSSLTTLTLFDNPKLESLGGGGELEEEQQQEPPPLFMSLHHLQITGSDGLSVLPEWLRCLASLQSLGLYYCSNLKMLPDGIQHLAGLKHLGICGCPLLAPRCERETGEDWHKIAHIPNLEIFP